MNTSMKKIAAFKRIAAIENARKVFTKEMKRTPFPEMYLKNVLKSRRDVQ